MPRGGNVKIAELYRKKKSEAIESCFSRPTYELDIGRGSTRNTRPSPSANAVRENSAAPRVLIYTFGSRPTVLYTEFVNLAQRISSRNRLRNACYIVSRDPR